MTSHYSHGERRMQRAVEDSARTVLVDSVAPDIVSGPGPGRNPPVFFISGHIRPRPDRIWPPDMRPD